ncbi:MAG: hypothetical protein A2W93_07400 [Bacteroidetes bacterium GWF2_43_63]|nr:MAG: hypothetical protein A2W94_15470 [Bacteroidetes bacterium GWE2_42_42]OFY54053.1 MAG: hypothetical protein A2W93_07400 [Bacteroidetes bacterium GWF2_43_63]HCB63537.1 hypothetical protein [Bacteroidales bacterium]HCY23217.1 hypothetical protein [Bacteroidales bacterium]
MNDFVRFEILKLVHIRVYLLLFLFLGAATPFVLMQSIPLTENQVAGSATALIALTLTYLFLFNRYKICGYLRMYEDRIEYYNLNKEIEIVCPVSEMRSLKLRVNGTHDQNFKIPYEQSNLNYSNAKKAVSRIVLTSSTRILKNKIRTKGYSYELLIEILEGYRKDGIDVKYTIFK